MEFRVLLWSIVMAEDDEQLDELMEIAFESSREGSITVREFMICAQTALEEHGYDWLAK